MAKNLLIVESPAKAKTIEKILGSDFQVKSCFGHIRDLEKEDMGIDIKDNFRPKYMVSKDKSAVVSELKKLAKSSQEVWLATDEDREGEAISWHLCEVLGLDPYSTKRIVFHEITKNAIQKAVANPRLLNMDLVNAQQARRILDRIVGFKISPILWRKMSLSHNLSAGRVQSVAVKLIVEKEREINAFIPTSTFKTTGIFNVQGKSVKAKLNKEFKNLEDIQKFLDGCKNSNYKINNVEVKPTKRTPSAPFTTSTLQQEASRKLGYGVSRTMLLAQKLYEAGYITYMRTDSVTLSETALQDIKQTIHTEFGHSYFQPRHFKNKNASAQEAHEAIRPTEMATKSVKNADEQKLYDLIRKRTLASQMADASLEKTNVYIDISARPENYIASGEVVKFDGFMKLYIESIDEDHDEESDTAILPPMSVGQILDLNEAISTQKYTRHSARYTEASLVKKLEEMGIGRPSTFAPTISTIQKREYVIKGDKVGFSREYHVLILKGGKVEQNLSTEMANVDRNKLIPTDIGLLVTDFLDKYFVSIMNYGFTAEIENQFDEIANGKYEYYHMLSSFYQPFNELVETTMETAERVKGERELGKDPVSGKPVFAKIGRYGPMVQIGTVEDEEKPRFAGLKAEQSVETITLEEAMKLFELPRLVGEYEDKDIKANIGRFGPYLMHNNAFYSLRKGLDPYDIDLTTSIEIIETKREADKKKFIKAFEDHEIQILEGRWGPFIKQGKTNIKIPKELKETAKDLTLEKCLELIGEVIKPVTKKAASKKSTVKKVAKKAATKKVATKKSIAKKK